MAAPLRRLVLWLIRSAPRQCRHRILSSPLSSYSPSSLARVTGVDKRKLKLNSSFSSASAAFHNQKRRYASNRDPADQPGFTSVLDQPPTLVRTGRKRHGAGLLFLVAIPATAFALGTWQVRRLQWKTELLATLEDRILKPPLPLPPRINPSAIPDEFDYRRVWATGRLRHDQEILVGPRVREGQNGYQVYTPLKRDDGATTVLVNRGWISTAKKRQRDRSPEALPQGQVTVEGLLRAPWKKNMFTPPNRPEIGEFYFPDIEQMAHLTGAQPVWIEETVVPDMIEALDAEAAGRPIGRAAEVNIRNNHLQYIVTWYGLSIATSMMLYIFLRKPPPGLSKRVRQSTEWA